MAIVSITMFSIKELSTKNGSRSNKPNQDAFSKWFISDDLSTPYGFMGVYDGHGNFGEYFSNYTKEYFDGMIPLHWERLNSDFHTTIRELFSCVNEMLKEKMVELLDTMEYETQVVKSEQENFTIQYRKNNPYLWKNLSGGSTCSLVIILEDKRLFHVHIGDSECIAIDKKDSGELFYTLLTKDHSPSSLEEYIRVQTNYDTPGVFRYNIHNGQFGPSIFTTDSEGNYIKKDPYILYRTNRGMYHKNVEGEFGTYFTQPVGATHQLSLMRSFGDFHLRPFGLSSVPDIVEYRFSENTIILLASDGLWDNWKKKKLFEEFKQWLSMGMSFIDIYTLLFTQTEQKATTLFGSQRDDITAVVFSKTF